ncbi:MAG: hypothetical protein WC211_12515 [Dehalococcoidia bacterium]
MKQAAGIIPAAIMLVWITGCVTVGDTAPPTPEPWVVTGATFAYEFPDGEAPVVAVDVNYTDIAGRDARWAWAIPYVTAKTVEDNEIYQCWRTLVIGEVLPPCLRRAFEERP